MPLPPTRGDPGRRHDLRPAELMDGTVALVTRAASGPGYATARELYERGARVALVDLDHAEVVKAAASLGGRAISVAGDVEDEGGIEAIVATVFERLGRVDLVVALGDAELEKHFHELIRSIGLQALRARPTAMTSPLTSVPGIARSVVDLPGRDPPRGTYASASVKRDGFHAYPDKHHVFRLAQQRGGITVIEMEALAVASREPDRCPEQRPRRVRRAVSASGRAGGRRPLHRAGGPRPPTGTQPRSHLTRHGRSGAPTSCRCRSARAYEPKRVASE